MTVWYDTINERQVATLFNKDLLSYMLENELTTNDIQFLFDDGYNEQNMTN